VQSIDAAVAACSYACLNASCGMSVCVMVTTVSPAKTAEPIESRCIVTLLVTKKLTILKSSYYLYFKYKM